MKFLTGAIIAFSITGMLFAGDIEVVGEVVDIQPIRLTENSVEILQVQLRIENREMVMAHLGPAWMFDIELEEGDELTCIGKYNGDKQFTVREMLRNTVRYLVRGEDYEPLWLRTKLQNENQFYNPQNEKMVKGAVEDLYIDERSMIMEAQVKTENGDNVRVKLAPEWYLQNNLRIGDELELRGSGVKSDGQVTILARQMRNLRTQQEIMLRNQQGFPQWCGKGACSNKQKGLPCCQDDKPTRGKK
jgi:hypothetical protein